MAQVVKLNTTVVTVIEPAAQQTLYHARERLDHRIDFVGRNAARHLVSVASWTLHVGSRLQRKFPGHLLLNSALAAVEDLLVDEALIPLPVPAGQSSATFCANRH